MSGGEEVHSSVPGGASLSRLRTSSGASRRQARRRARRLLDQQTDLESIRRLTWLEFERLVAEAYRRQGYSVVENGGGGADGGVDLVLDKEGTVLVQCKQWQAFRVGVKEVRELFGILAAENAAGAILITSGRFTDEACAFAAGKPLELIDGAGLLTLIRSSQAVAGSLASRAATPSPRPAPPSAPACPRCGHPMVLRTAQHGPRAGSRFWGCSKYQAAGKPSTSDTRRLAQVNGPPPVYASA